MRPGPGTGPRPVQSSSVESSRVKELPSEFQLPGWGMGGLATGTGTGTENLACVCIKGLLDQAAEPATNVIINSPKLRQQRLMLSDTMPIHSKIVGGFFGSFFFFLGQFWQPSQASLAFRIQAKPYWADKEGSTQCAQGGNYDEPWSKNIGSIVMRTRESSEWGTTGSCHCLPAPLIAWWPCWKCSLKVLQKLKHFTIVFTGRLTRLSRFRFDALFISCCYLSTRNPTCTKKKKKTDGAIKLSVPRFGPSLSRGRLDAVTKKKKSSISFFLFKRSRFSWQGDWREKRAS